MTIEHKLQDIFERRLEVMESETSAASESVRQILLKQEWNNLLDSLDGVKRISFLLAIVTEESPEHIRINDPLVFGGNQGIISLEKETAMKIVALGGLP